MQKRNREYRNPIGVFDMQRLVTCTIKDLSRYIGDEGSAKLAGTLITAPGEFRGCLDGMLQTAESYLENPSGLHEVGAFHHYVALRQLQAFVKKVPDWHSKSEEERHSAAKVKFDKAELNCKLTNKRLSFYKEHWSRGAKKFPVRVLNSASLLVQEILGPLDHDVEREILESARFGSGATFSHSGHKASPYYKLAGDHTVTKEAIPVLQRWMALSPRIHSLVSGSELDVVLGNRLSSVPKDWDISRMIAIEPSWNVFLQLGLNGFLGERLKKFGLNLRNQSLGWRWAREGSISGSHATIDLSSASDCISEELVRWLLPSPWFDLFDSLRSKYYQDQGEWTKYHKFSSMGNGFTFPLETIIFFALAMATARELGAGRQRVTVYGDDIVVPRGLYCPLAEVLRFSGFETNSKKSYAFGHFRETCGRDFLQGVNIRPTYLRRVPKSEADVFSLYNRLWTNCMLPLPETMAFLRSLVKGNFVGPGFTGRSRAENLSVNGPYSDVPEWRRDDHRYESYYFDDPPVHRRWSSDLQAFVYKFFMRDKRYKKDEGAKDEHIRLLCFLLGIQGGEIRSTTRVKFFNRFDTTTCWPTMAEVRLHGLEKNQR